MPRIASFLARVCALLGGSDIATAERRAAAALLRIRATEVRLRSMRRFDGLEMRIGTTIATELDTVAARLEA
jgi:hypothetical protein